MRNAGTLLCLAALLASVAARADEPVSAARGERLLTQYHCQACHQPYEARQGPSLQAIARRFADDPHAIDVLEAAILNGSTGVWGSTPMGPYDVPEKDLKPLVEWILAFR